MSVWKDLLTPFSLLWKYSGLLAPARNIIREAEHWSDYVAAVIYIIVAFGVLLLLAIYLSTEFVYTLLAIAVALVVIKYAWYYLSS